MSRFDAYRNSFPNARLARSKTGVLEVALHTDSHTLVFNGHTHEQFVDLFHAVGSDPDNRVVILTGSGKAFMETINPEGFDFFTPQGYDKIYREVLKFLMNILDIEVPLIAAVNGPVRLHSEYILLADIVLATPSTVFQDKPHFELGIASGDRELYAHRHDPEAPPHHRRRRHARACIGGDQRRRCCASEDGMSPTPKVWFGDAVQDKPPSNGNGDKAR